MFKNVLIFFLLVFFFFPKNLVLANNFTANQASEIKKRVFIVDRLVSISRSKKPIIYKKKEEEISVVFDAIKNQKWSQAKKLVKENKILIKIINWHFLTENKKPKFFPETESFILENPDWPKKIFLRKKMELFIGNNMSNKKKIEFFNENPPLTTKGAINYVDALRKRDGIDSVKSIAKQTWINRKFTRSQSKDFYKKYKKILNEKDHLERIEKLTWIGRNYEARRMLSLINKNSRNLYNAKIILRRRAGNADHAVSLVPKNLLNDPGLIYERLRWRRKNRLYNTAYEIIDPLPSIIKYEKKWWVEISIIVRKLIEYKKYQEAYNLVVDFSSKSKEYLSESKWYAGWIGYEFLKIDPNTYINHFLNSYENTEHIGEKAKSAYWVGKSYEKTNNKELSKLWYETSSKFVTEFYGQLSFEKINNNENVLISNEELYGKNLFTKEDLNFVKTDLYKAAEILLIYGTRDNAKVFISQLIRVSKTPGQLQIVAKMAKDHNRPDLAIKAAKYAKKKGVYLYHYVYPSLSGIKINKEIEKELVYAIIKQESAFNNKAISRVGARGIMQIMPATAKKVSKELKITYSKKRLTSDPQFNVTIGSSYLNNLVKEYDSYLLALIGYNAGPRRIRRWIKKHGDPRKKNVDPISWIEKIPIKETRLYVKIVLSNLQIYRQKNQVSKNKKILLQKNRI